MNKWKPEPHEFDENKTHKETAEGYSMTSLRGYLKEIGNPELYFSVYDGDYCMFDYEDGHILVWRKSLFIRKFHCDSYRWAIIDDKELLITEKNNPLAQTYVFIPMAPAQFSKGGEQ